MATCSKVNWDGGILAGGLGRLGWSKQTPKGWEGSMGESGGQAGSVKGASGNRRGR